MILFVFLLYVGHLSITIKPFTAQLPYWHRSLGLFLLILSFIVYNAGENSMHLSIVRLRPGAGCIMYMDLIREKELFSGS